VGCGNATESVIIFTIFAIVVILIFLNLFIAIILEGYHETSERNEKMFNNDIRERFRDVWSKFD
jgi:uncharacterized membrane protein